MVKQLSKKTVVEAGEDEDSEEKDRKDLVYPSPLSEAEKLALFKTFRKKGKKDDGKIIQDESKEVIEITWDSYRTAGKYYGSPMKFVAIFVLVLGVKFCEHAYDMALAEWANAK